jgi:hypothetical protein
MKTPVRFKILGHEYGARNVKKTDLSAVVSGLRT